MNNRLHVFRRAGVILFVCSVAALGMDLGYSLANGGRDGSFFERVSCSIFHPSKTYQRMGDYGRSTDEIVGAWWCMDEDDIREWIVRESHV